MSLTMNTFALFIRFPNLRGATRQFSPLLSARTFSTAQPAAGEDASPSSHERPPTGVVLLNMGGPSRPEDTRSFLKNLFSDRDIIDLGGGRFQQWAGELVSKRRTPGVQAQYEVIRGSPIRRWTEYQGAEFVKQLDELHPATAPHKAYVAFRYADPLTEEALTQMKADGVERAVAFTQYPQFSCTTSGSSFNHLWRTSRRLGLEDAFQWSIIDRWPTHPTYIRALAKLIRKGLQGFPVAEREKAVIMFSAHSLPMKTVLKGDPYVPEIAATVHAVMQELGHSNTHILAWQSKVGYLPWMGPSTEDVIKKLGAKGCRSVLAVPVAFTSDHIETLYEIDVEYKEEAEKVGIKHFLRSESLNGEPLLIQAQAEIVAEHLER